MKDAIGYLRVSTKEQGRSGLGLVAQRQDFEAFGSRVGFAVKNWHQDIQTGAGKDALLLRAGLAAASKQTRSPALSFGCVKTPRMLSCVVESKTSSPWPISLRMRRDDHLWTAWIFVAPRVVTDMLMILLSGRSTFLSLNEKKAYRDRWLTSISLQTADPAAED